MTIYLADRQMPNVTLQELAAAQRAAIETSQRFTLEGKPVRYIRSTWIPGDDRVQCLFEAEAPEVVADVNRAAGIPFKRVIEALDLTPRS